ncbi:MAG: NTP transferase domain-containing protein [Comamonadaceae bacterium]|nr:NTP transferase domain-containing protein [Comamonadaceae bacterium]
MSAGGITGLILAGGQGRRMGGVDKGLERVRAARPMVQRVIERLRAAGRRRCSSTPTRMRETLRRLRPSGRRRRASAASPVRWPGCRPAWRSATTPLLVTAPCDSPFLPRGPRRAACARRSSRSRRQVAVARTGDQPHPVFALCRREVLAGLTAFLAGRRAQDRRVVRCAAPWRKWPSTTRPTPSPTSTPCEELDALGKAKTMSSILQAVSCLDDYDPDSLHGGQGAGPHPRPGGAGRRHPAPVRARHPRPRAGRRT